MNVLEVKRPLVGHEILRMILLFVDAKYLKFILFYFFLLFWYLFIYFIFHNKDYTSIKLYKDVARGPYFVGTMFMDCNASELGSTIF